MKFLQTVFGLGMLALAIAKPTAELNKAKQVAAEAGKTLADGERVQFYELWPPSKHTETNCVSGYGHVVLVVGAKSGDDFVAEAYDLYADKKNGKFEGGTNHEEHKAWRLTSKSGKNVYQWINVAPLSTAALNAAGPQWIAANPKYSVANANCKTFVQYLAGPGAPVPNKPAKRSIDDTLETLAMSGIEARDLEEFDSLPQLVELLA